MKLKTRTNQPVMSEDGQIDLPIGAGGTKLYKHTLSLSQATPVAKFVLITTFDTPLADNGNLKTILISQDKTQIISMIYATQSSNMYFYLSGGSGPHLFTLTYESSIGASEVGDTTYYKDTVTPL